MHQPGFFTTRSIATDHLMQERQMDQSILLEDFMEELVKDRPARIKVGPHAVQHTFPHEVTLADLREILHAVISGAGQKKRDRGIKPSNGDRWFQPSHPVCLSQMCLCLLLINGGLS